MDYGKWNMDNPRDFWWHVFEANAAAIGYVLSFAAGVADSAAAKLLRRVWK